MRKCSFFIAFCLIILSGCKKNPADSSQLPVVITLDVTSITDSSADASGNVSDGGGSAVIVKGFVYGKDNLPTLDNSLKTIDSSGVGVFTSRLNKLSASTTYYLRTYATNSNGTSYGKSVAFTTQDADSLPVVITQDISALTDSSALVGGSIVDNGGLPVIEHGIVYSTDSLPTLTNSLSVVSNFSGSGYFNCFLIGLYDQTTYYARAYATNRKGTAYGNQLVFQTLRNKNTFVFSKNQYTDTTLASTKYLCTYPHFRASFTNYLSLPQGVFLYIQIDSVYGNAKFITDSAVINLHSGDTVHIANDGRTYLIDATPGFYDNVGNFIGNSECWYSVKIGGKAITADNTYYCHFYVDYGLSNTSDFWRFYTDNRRNCNF